MKSKKINNTVSKHKQVNASNKPIVINSSSIKVRPVTAKRSGGCCGKVNWKA
ncbi:hypothetical protein [Oceanobacillus sp. CF4.6]|uniref:hypothetical protein n=1 Tax=Oceanobacillus sp. CF4.6 TaxID=3373080 RepID=UPI003EE42DF1